MPNLLSILQPLTPAELRERGLAECAMCEKVFRREELEEVGELYCKACVSQVCAECGEWIETPAKKIRHACGKPERDLDFEYDRMRDELLLRSAEKGE